MNHHARKELREYEAHTRYTQLREAGHLNLEIAPPIDPTDIPDFAEWINWHPIGSDLVVSSNPRELIKPHNGLDYAVYLNTKGQVVVGLPGDTPVRAIAGGQVIIDPFLGGMKNPYSSQMIVVHETFNDVTFKSVYAHAKRSIRMGQVVKKGDVIGTAYKEDGEEGRLVHLHLTMGFSPVKDMYNLEYLDPELFFPDFSRLTTTPFGRFPFKVDGHRDLEIVVSNFRKVNANGTFLERTT
jgi:murein DD-endopeptidase MepM/ murein hydrolase activator NlpD